jgi:phosphatidylglycerol---prolipoprotein diacylglyceryl transferase
MEWAVDPEIFTLPFIGRGVRWYGLLFAGGFLLGYQFFVKIYTEEKRPLKDLDALLMTLMLGTIIGARLGHCLFYEPSIYLNNPLRILKIWEGGLASHGGVLGNIIAVYIYSRTHKNQPFIWLADRIIIPTALVACFIRLGNLFNSEILGKPTDLPWGIHFSLVDRAEVIYRHPSMLYESLCYLFTFIVMRILYKKWKPNVPEGRLVGIFSILIFSGRFLIEFSKENQVAFESGMLINMGQILSLPFIALGIYLIIRSRRFT